MTEAAVIAPVQRDLEALIENISQWLSTKIPDASNLMVKDLSYPLGAGLSNETILFDALWAEGTDLKNEGFVLRLAPGDYQVYMEIDFKGQFDLQKSFNRTGVVPVPEMLWFESDPALFGAPFFVMKRLRGHVAVSHPPYATHGWVAEASNEGRRNIWRNGIEALAKLNHVPLNSIQILNKPQHGDNGWDQEWNYWMKSHQWSRDGRVLPTCDAIISWLEENKPAQREAGLCWGDSRLGNLMYDDDFNVIAVIDWEGASLGGGLQDLGFWLFLDSIMGSIVGGLPEGFGSREETIALWEEVSGVSAADIEWYEVFGGLKLASHVARKLSLDGNAKHGYNYNNNPATQLVAQKLGLTPPIDAY